LRIKPIFNDINICLAGNINYSEPMRTMIYSILRHADMSRKYEFIILSSDFTDDIKAKFERFKADNIAVRFVDMAAFHEKVKDRGKNYITAETNYRLYLLSDDFAEYRRMLYLDCDMQATDDISKLCEGGNLSFYDAAAPIVTAESIDMSVAFIASRYGKGGADYINCPMNKEEYESFYNELINAESAVVSEFDKPLKVYEGCMPIEILAKRGHDSIRFGPLKPVGLTDPRTGHRPWAVVQLRKENSSGTLYNLVGFQTNLKFPEQKRVFSMIPSLKNAEFMRYGVMHRNSFINSPKLLNKDLSLKQNQNIYFAGQISGVEGYMESAASGILAGINVAAKLKNQQPLILPEFSMIGALINYICDDTVTDFQPMGANFGILPPLETKIRDKRERYSALSKRSLDWFLENIK